MLYLFLFYEKELVVCVNKKIILLQLLVLALFKTSHKSSWFCYSGHNYNFVADIKRAAAAGSINCDL